MRIFRVRMLLCVLLAAGTVQAQLSSSAYRVLGQTDLQSNGLNMAGGVSLHNPGGVALDVRGGQEHVYICDTGNSRVLAWADLASYHIGDSPALVLGQPAAGDVSAYGIGAKGFNGPTAIAVDPNTGNLYVADTGNNRVLRFPSPFDNPARIEPDAVYGQPDFTTFTAGSSPGSLSAPRGVAVDAAGNLWVADSGNNRILRFAAATPGASVPPPADTVIGQADFVSNSSNQGATAPSASSLYAPAGLAFDAQGNLYVADYGNTRVLRFAPPAGGSLNPAANAVWGETGFTTRGVPPQPSASTMAGPIAVAVDGSGNVYAAVPRDNRVLVFTASAAGGGAATMVLGQTDFTTTTPDSGAFPMASASTLSGPADVKVDPRGNLFVADSQNNRALQFAPQAKSAALVWGQSDFVSNGANQIKPGSINAPYKMVVDYSRAPYALYVADIGNNRVLVWKDSTAFRNGDPADLVIGQPNLRTAAANVDAQGAAPSRTSLFAPAGLALNPSDGTLYVADSGNNRVLRYPRPVDQTGRIAPDAVIGQVDFKSSTSAAVSASSLNAPTGLAFSADGHLFIADTGNNRVLEFGAGAGTGASAIRVYGQPNMNSSLKPAQVTSQTLAAPRGLFVDSASNLYVADTADNRVVVFAYTENAPPYGAAAAYTIGSSVLNSPADVALDSGGNVYVSDSGNNRVLIFSSPISIVGPSLTGVVGQPDTTSKAVNWDAGNGLASADSLAQPLGVYVDRQDTLYVGDAGNNRVLQFLKGVSAMNAADFQTGAPVAQSGLATLLGAALASDSATAPPGPWPAKLVNRVVVINDQTPAPLSLMSPGQINFQVPASAPLGTDRVAVRTADTGELVAGGGLPVASASPGLFTTGQSGSGQGLILNQDGTPNGASNPAPVGSTITLYGTGQGQVSPAVSDGAPAPGPPMAATVAVPTSDGQTCLTVQPSLCVAIGSAFGTVQASGLAPGYIGVWQINVTIPQGTPSGGAVPLRAVIDGIPSNIVTVAVK